MKTIVEKYIYRIVGESQMLFMDLTCEARCAQSAEYDYYSGEKFGLYPGS